MEFIKAFWFGLICLWFVFFIFFVVVGFCGFFMGFGCWFCFPLGKCSHLSFDHF